MALILHETLPREPVRRQRAKFWREGVPLPSAFQYKTRAAILTAAQRRLFNAAFVSGFR
jgi:hypothetical protein